MPDRFIPLIVQFNLSQRFDMLVLETLFSMLHKHPGQRFSVNLLPATLMQKNSAGQIIALFQRYSVSPELITIEVTEEQAFSMRTPVGKILKRCARLAAPSLLMTLAPAMRTMNV
ncbi:hypothetical protein HMPREF0484_2221 [Klebsiella pneumoniae subsp. rhinoscleromatis ATCC 13884]|nr:hypothetical protein HMPREF0484_2221 [Klebsiella pneumoniae subsp. rhinoscleromatis ATCC 13884]